MRPCTAVLLAACTENLLSWPPG